jgi:cation diffusion facilitator CzcD-associated flavoprotein CzcO
MMEHIKSLEDTFNERYNHVFLNTPEQAGRRKMFEDLMRDKIKDQRIINGILPDFPAGCRRIVPGDPFMKAIQKDNVDVRFTHATKVTRDGVIGVDGVERRCDTIVCATGRVFNFENSSAIVY